MPENERTATGHSFLSGFANQGHALHTQFPGHVFDQAVEIRLQLVAALQRRAHVRNDVVRTNQALKLRGMNQLGPLFFRAPQMASAGWMPVSAWQIPVQCTVSKVFSIDIVIARQFR